MSSMNEGCRRSISTGLLSWACVVLFLTQSLTAQLAPENVMVLYNAADADSIEVAQYYAGSRPGVQLLGLSNVPAGEEISAESYLSNLRPQILAGLNDDIDVIVTTTGLPLRIKANSAATREGKYSSFESELTRIDTIDSLSLMTNQWWALPDAFGGNSKALNPYYGSDSSFSYTETGIRLSSRLDSYSVETTKAMIDRAQNSYISGQVLSVVVDDDPVSRPDKMLELATGVLPAFGQSVTYDTSADAILEDSTAVIGYVSHGTNDSGELGKDYITDQLDLILVKGAIFATQESYNAFSFTEGVTKANQGQIGQWLEIGGTAAVGHVEEPAVGTTNVANEDLLFEGMLGGRTWVESAWSSIFQTSYVNTVVGDPLMVWQEWLPGDATFDGLIDVQDLAIVATGFGTLGNIHRGDSNGDQQVDILDLSILATHYSHAISNSGSVPIPEPATSFTVFLGALSLVLVRNRKVCGIAPKTVDSREIYL